MPWDSSIIRITTGRLNTVNDTVIGGDPSIGSRSRYAGQLGKTVWFDPSQIAGMFDTTIGTLYGGRYRYVRMRDADDDSPAVQVGQTLFWDTTATAGTASTWMTAYQVTRDENLSSGAENAVMIAGIYIGGFTGGKYGFIQDLGMVPVKFRSVLTVAGTIGCRAYAAGAGDLGTDQGTADVLTTDSTSIANARFLGNAVSAPSANSLTPVLLGFHTVLA